MNLTPEHIEKFWSKVQQSDGCWEWQGNRSPLNYGKFYPAMGLKFLSHRVMYELTYGPIPAGLCVLHRCDNPPCVRPDHLFLGTRTENAADRQAKGRTRTGTLRGPDNKFAKLTADQVRYIRQQLANGKRGTGAALAREFDVSQSTISHIGLGKHYQVVTDDRATRSEAEAELDRLAFELLSRGAK